MIRVKVTEVIRVLRHMYAKSYKVVTRGYHEYILPTPSTIRHVCSRTQYQ